MFMGLKMLMEDNSLEVTKYRETKQIVLWKVIWVENSWRLGGYLGDQIMLVLFSLFL